MGNAGEERAFLFTDVEGSTRLWEQHPDLMRLALARHDDIVQEEVAAAGGYVFSTAGDAFAVAFPTAGDAAAAATAIQRRLSAERWDDRTTIRVRMGIHWGPSTARGGDFFGPTLNRSARVMSAAHGGQLVLTDSARRHVPEVACRDLGEHHLKDLSLPERIWQVEIEGLLDEFPPLRTLDPDRNNLPNVLTTFVGREDELAGLKGELRTERLVTLHGVGGVGKTRLALQAAADASGRYPEGVWFVDLASVRDGEGVPHEIADVVGAIPSPDQTVTAAAVAAIGSGTLLLVIDNCEQVVAAVGEVVAELLAACPNVDVVATSRAALGLDGEVVRAVRPLDADSDQAPAVELFVDRARRANGRLPIDDESLAVIRALCQRLDGVPLAIELAASRVRSMTPAEIADRLDRRFRVLQRRSTTTEGRHDTLHATIQWSYDLLDDDARAVFDRAGVFAGRFTRDAAEAVCAGDDLDQFDVSDLLDLLVDQSMIIADVSGPATVFRLLDSLREFALERLGDDAPAARDGHAAHLAQRAATVAAALNSPDEAAGNDEMDRLWPDVRAAVAWARSRGRGDQVAQLIGHLGFDAVYRGRAEAPLWAQAALDLPGLADLPPNDAACLRLTAACGQLVRSNEAMLQLIDAARRILEGAPGTPTTPDLNVSVSILFFAGEMERGFEMADWIVGRYGPDSVNGAMAHIALAVLHTYAGRSDEALALARKGLAAGEGRLPETYRTMGEWTAARNEGLPVRVLLDRVEQAVKEFDSIGNTFLANTCRRHAAALRIEAGDLGESMSATADLVAGASVDDPRELLGALMLAAIELLRAGEDDVPAVLLAHQDAKRHTPISNDYRAKLAELTPAMEASLGGDGMVAARRRMEAMTDAAVAELAVNRLRELAAQLSAP